MPLFLKLCREQNGDVGKSWWMEDPEMCKKAAGGRYWVIRVSCCGCIAVSSLPKSQFLIASNSSEPPSTTFSHPGVSEEKEEKSFLFHQKPCLRLFWSRLDDWQFFQFSILDILLQYIDTTKGLDYMHYCISRVFTKKYHNTYTR